MLRRLGVVRATNHFQELPRVLLELRRSDPSYLPEGRKGPRPPGRQLCQRAIREHDIRRHLRLLRDSTAKSLQCSEELFVARSDGEIGALRHGQGAIASPPPRLTFGRLRQ